MKFILLLIIQVLFSIQSFAQFTAKTKGKASVHRTFKTTTYFVLTGNEKVDIPFKKGVKDYWTITPTKFIEEDSLSFLVGDSDKSFVYFNDLKEKGNSKKMRALCFVNGGYNSRVTYVDNCISSISIDTEGFETDDSRLTFRLGHMLFQLQDVARICKEENYIEKNSVIVKAKFIKFYKTKTSRLRKKTLLIDEKYLSRKIVSKQEMENAYKYNIEFVNKDVIEKAIKEKDSSKAYLISALNLYKVNTVTDCGTGEIIFAEFEEKDPVTRVFVKNFDRDDMMLINANARSGK